MGVLAKYGFQDVVQRARLSPYIPIIKPKEDLIILTQPQRARMVLEELGPTFIKFGQVLAARSDLIPAAYVEEFKKLQDRVPSVEFSEIIRVLKKEWGEGYTEVFTFIDPKPIGSASIAQVHVAKMFDGKEVVLKVKKPGIEKIIDDDIGILRLFADLINRYLPELESLNVSGLIEEFCSSIKMETNFVVEANNVRRFQDNFKEYPAIKIPDVYLDYCTQGVLVLERLNGIPLSHPDSLKQQGISRDQIMRAGLEAYFTMVFKNGLFHGDLHAGNLFILPDNRIGLIDFGMVGRLSRKHQSLIASMFIALAQEDYERLAFEYLEMAPPDTHVDIDDFAGDLRSLLSPFFGLNLSKVNLGKILLDSTTVASRYKIRIPSELMMFIKSLVTIEGLGRMVLEEFDILPYVKDFSVDLFKSRMSKDELFSDASTIFREVNALVHTAPREVRQILKKWNHPSHKLKIEIKDLGEIENEIARAGKLHFIGMLIGSLVIAGAISLPIKIGGEFEGVPVISAIMFAMAGFLSLVYIRR